MRQKTNENKSTSCVYQELNPEMDAFLAGYLEDGRHRGLRESTIHLHDKIWSVIIKVKSPNARKGDKIITLRRDSKWENGIQARNAGRR